MSHEKNTEWLEGAYENFRDAVEVGNIALAKDIIQDTLDAGFGEDGRKMNLELRELTQETSEKKGI